MAEVMVLHSLLFSTHGLVGVYSSRCGGVSLPPYDTLDLGMDVGDDPAHVQCNMALFMRAAGLEVRPHQARQAHGIGVLACHGDGLMHAHEADILISSDPQAALAVRTADCLPLLLADPATRILAAVHAGWRGTARLAAMVAVRAMQQLGAEPGRMLASLGPCIGPCCFRIDEQTAQQLAANWPPADAHITRRKHIAADLAAINRDQLLAAGMKAEHIEVMGACTCCQPQRFFSYRRDGARSGRHLAVVALGPRA